jgi:hypothetical protein
MVNISLVLTIPAHSDGDTTSIMKVLERDNISELLGVTHPVVPDLLGDSIVVNLHIVGEFSPLPFMRLYNAISYACTHLELEYTGRVTLADGVEYDIEGNATIIDNSWAHAQRAGVYVGGSDE